MDENILNILREYFGSGGSYGDKMAELQTMLYPSGNNQLLPKESFPKGPGGIAAQPIERQPAPYKPIDYGPALPPNMYDPQIPTQSVAPSRADLVSQLRNAPRSGRADIAKQLRAMPSTVLGNYGNYVPPSSGDFPDGQAYMKGWEGKKVDDQLAYVDTLRNKLLGGM